MSYFLQACAVSGLKVHTQGSLDLGVSSRHLLFHVFERLLVGLAALRCGSIASLGGFLV